MKKFVDLIVQTIIVIMFILTIVLPKKEFSNNENRYLRNSGRKTEQENEKKLNELKENIKNNETGINEIKKDYENDKINNENKIQILNKKIIDLESKLNINLNKNAKAKNNVEENQRIFDSEYQPFGYATLLFLLCS